MAHVHPVLDVRSPGEYQHAHIPGAYSFPLFTDEERKVVGTAYKQQGRQAAIRHGLAFFGVKMLPMVEDALTIARQFYSDEISNEEQIILVHCWRGGMRSAAVAWLLDLYGFKVYTLTGGYKAYRNWVLKQLDINYDLQVIGGYTGSNKTGLLQLLADKGEAVIDLEKLASHKGSAFGALGMQEQPAQEMFENMLATELYKVAGRQKKFWIEDESRRIGKLMIPAMLFEQMRKNTIIFLSVPFEERLKLITDQYGNFDKQLLTEAIERIQKRLGGLEAKNAIALLEEGNVMECFRILLAYYDKCYLKGLESRSLKEPNCHKIGLETTEAAANAAVLLQQLKMEI